jgi:hypothetical protein
LPPALADPRASIPSQAAPLRLPLANVSVEDAGAEATDCTDWAIAETIVAKGKENTAAPPTWSRAMVEAVASPCRASGGTASLRLAPSVAWLGKADGIPPSLPPPEAAEVGRSDHASSAESTGHTAVTTTTPRGRGNALAPQSTSICTPRGSGSAGQAQAAPLQLSLANGGEGEHYAPLPLVMLK